LAGESIENPSISTLTVISLGSVIPLTNKCLASTTNCSRYLLES